MAQLRNAETTLARQVARPRRQYAQSTLESAVAARDSAAATVDRTRAVIAQKTIVAPFAGRLGISKVDVGQYVAVGTSMVTLQQLDPDLRRFPVPEQALGTLAVGQDAI